MTTKNAKMKCRNFQYVLSSIKFLELHVQTSHASYDVLDIFPWGGRYTGANNINMVIALLESLGLVVHRIRQRTSRRRISVLVLALAMRGTGCKCVVERSFHRHWR